MEPTCYDESMIGAEAIYLQRASKSGPNQGKRTSDNWPPRRKHRVGLGRGTHQLAYHHRPVSPWACFHYCGFVDFVIVWVPLEPVS